MDTAGDPRPSAAVRAEESSPLDLRDHTLLDLLTSRDPALIEAAEKLLAHRMERQEQVLLGWNSRIEKAARSDR